MLKQSQAAPVGVSPVAGVSSSLFGFNGNLPIPIGRRGRRLCLRSQHGLLASAVTTAVFAILLRSPPRSRLRSLQVQRQYDQGNRDPPARLPSATATTFSSTVGRGSSPENFRANGALQASPGRSALCRSLPSRVRPRRTARIGTFGNGRALQKRDCAGLTYAPSRQGLH